MSFTQPILIHDEEHEVLTLWDDQLALIDYSSDGSEPETTAAYTAETPPTTAASGSRKKTRPSLRLKNGPIELLDSEITEYKLGNGAVVAQGDTVELTNDHPSMPDTNQSGDFLRVRNIITNNQTDDVRLRGHRLRRTKYLSQLFDWKLNELVMMLCVNEADTRTAFVAGIEEVSVDEIFCVRECVFTDQPFPLLSFRDTDYWSVKFRKGLSDEDMKESLFREGCLVCRVFNILIIRNKVKGKAQSGTIRQLYATEAHAASTGADQGHRVSRSGAIQVDDNGSRSGPRKQHSPMPVDARQLTFGDVFCGAGGSSQGAKQAGLAGQWGLDLTRMPLKLMGRIILPLCVSIPALMTFRQKGIPASSLATVHGRNDQANLDAIYTVGPILTKLEPRVAILEQTSGLSTRYQHKASFQMLLHDIGKAEYNVRWKNSDFSEYGLVQRRKRLVIIAASGLKPWHSVQAALHPIERLSNHPAHDPYHQPKPVKTPREPYDPRGLLKGCITTDGGVGKYHYNGTRKYTLRELSLLQSFPMGYKFTGGQVQAIKQIGNEFHPQCEVGDAPLLPPASPDHRAGSIAPPPGYLARNVPVSARSTAFKPTRLARTRLARHQRSRGRSSRLFSVRNMSLLDGLLDGSLISGQDGDRDMVEAIDPPPPRTRRAATGSPVVSPDVIDISSGSEDNDDGDSMGLLDGFLDGSNVLESAAPLPPRNRRPATVTTNVSQDVIDVSSGSDYDRDGDDGDTIYSDVVRNRSR
ncbi:hypothetical protein HBH98_243990 [Parastagonospora nodorum]|nr:hypothetical protein HBH51_243910 [Parastagonospora nodorum]KAH4215544.1 hypothetical protein HBI06_247960 [Parastagonospora nodorum]KAH4334262.1 hypothetical protein HBH98_243990 [Parastagonospora nodorum]KAH4355115.1 hypothetical protein HBH97_240040 [Parastagonospora nodorum]KAH4368763.1 hypothetical protein HBH99_245140 [Parastagonospora nodorum]